MGIKSSKNKKGNKKHGRMEVWCKAYRSRNQREKNKTVRLRNHLERYPDDKCAVSCLERLRVFAP